MKYTFTDLPIGSCFVGKNGKVKKKITEQKAALVKENGRVSMGKMKSQAEVESTGCPLNLLGVGLRRHPEMVIQIGDGNILERRGRKRR